MKKLYHVILTLIILLSMALPLAIAKPAMASSGILSVYATSNSGVLRNLNAVYNTAWTAASGTIDRGDSQIIGQYYGLGYGYEVYRSTLFFDTSALPDDATITSATIKLYGQSDQSTTDFNITIQNGQPTYPHDPLVVADYDKSNYSSSGGTLSTSGWTTSGYNNLSLDATGMTWISLTGATKLCLRSSRDIAGTTPTGLERIGFYSAQYYISAKRPYIEINYTTADPVAYVSTNNAVNVGTSSATLQGTLNSLGSYGSGNVSFQYGTTTSYGVNSPEATMTAVGTFNYLAIGLAYNTTYHFRALVRFDTYYFYGEDFVFTTLPAVGSSTDLRIISVAVFSGYIEDDDLLFTVETINNYTDYYPVESAREWFSIQLLDTDDSIVLGASPLSNWGDRPSSIYFNADSAASLAGGSAYYIKMLAPNIPGVTPVEQQLTSSNWKGIDLIRLDDWCRGVAINMQMSDNRNDYLTTTNAGILITDNASGYFTQGIPGIAQVRPNLFETSVNYPLFPGGTADNQFDTSTTWDAQVGVKIAADVAIIADLFSTDGRTALAWLFGAVIFIITIAGIVMGGKALGLLLLNVPILMYGNYLRVIDIQITVIFALIMVFFFVRQFIFKTT